MKMLAKLGLLVVAGGTGDAASGPGRGMHTVKTPCFARAAVQGARWRAPCAVCALRCRAAPEAAPAEAKSSEQALASILAEDSLAKDGIVRVPVDTAMVDEMLAAYQQLRKTTGNQFRRCAPARGPVSRSGARENIMWTEEIPCSVEASNFRLADGTDEVYDV